MSARPSPQASRDASPADALWLAAPCPAVRLWPDPLRWRLNDAADTWAAAQGLTEAAWRALAETIAAAVFDGRLEGQAQAGRDAQLRWNAVPLDEARTSGWLVWLHVALSRQSERQHESNLEPATILELAGLSVWRIDPATRRIRFNSAGYRAMGLPADTPGLDLDAMRAMVHPADRDAIVLAAEAATRETAPVDVTARYRNPDGSYRTLLTRRVAQRDAQGRVLAVLGVSFDMSAEVAAREQARALSLSMELVSDVAGVGLWSLDPQTGSVEWNAQMFRLYGMSPDEPAPPAATWMGERVHPDDRKRVAAERRRAADAGAPGFETEFRVRQPDGGWRWVACRSRRAERDGRPVLYGIHLDITEAKQAEQALRDKAAAEQASKAKSEFLAHMSHELRTPLNAVIGFSQLIAADTAQRALDPLQSERLHRIEDAGRHLLALIDDVLDLAAIEAGSLPVASEAVDVAAALSDVRQWTEPLARAAEVSVEIDLSAAADASVRADPRRLRQVLANLLGNGIKYNRRGGTVRVHGRGERRQGRDGWLIGVTDDGPGLTPEQKTRLFEPFNRLGAERGSVAGTGIGLTIARRLVERMGGTLEADAAVRQGCEFRVWLPTAEPPAAAAAPSTRATTAAGGRSPPPDAQRLTMLYIEDNPVNLLLVQELTERCPLVDLSTAGDGASGVAQALASPPDVVLVDIQLPDFDGFEVLRRLRAAPALDAAVIIALSANAMPDDMARARAEGFADYWTKPIDFAQFLGALDALVARRHPAQGASRSRTHDAPSSR